MNRVLLPTDRTLTALNTSRIAAGCCNGTSFVACPAAMLVGLPQAQLHLMATMYSLAAAVAVKQVARQEILRQAALNN